MARKQKLTLWYDKEGDYLEVLFNEDEPGTFEETAHDQVMVRLNLRNEVIGFSILSLSKLEEPYLDLALEKTTEPA
jgi:hypothetical protein